MRKQTVKNIKLAGERVLMRVDFNVPIQDGRVADDTRIAAALPTIRYVLEQGGSLVLMSHLGRPKGKRDDAFSLRPVADRLAEHLGKPVAFADDCVDRNVEQQAADLQPGDVLLLENVRFHAEEEGKISAPEGAPEEEVRLAKAGMKERQQTFASKLASLGTVYVNDAFGAAHRSHASTTVITDFVDISVAGLLMEKELDYLGKALADPVSPFVAIMGGAKISGKIDVIINLMERVDALLIGGGMAYTFYRAKGIATGNSLVEEDKIELASEILEKALAAKVRLMLPSDHVIADSFSEEAQTRTCDEEAIPDGWMALDIGPRTRKEYARVIGTAKTVLWNGPMGAFEMAPFAEGTFSVARAVATMDGTSIIGGGDSVSAVKQSGLADQMTHISTGGGASLEFLEGKPLPGVVVLDDGEAVASAAD